jgi:josephin
LAVRGFCDVLSSNLNNLHETGKDKLSKKVFDRAAAKLGGNTFMNPHKSMFGLGNYDANILILILQDRFVLACLRNHLGGMTDRAVLFHRGYQVDWYDRRREINELNFDSLFGVICNSVSAAPLGMWKIHHWFSVRKVRIW